MTVTNLSWIHEEMKNRLNSENASYFSVQNNLSSRLLLKNVKIYKTVNLIIGLRACETLSVVLKELGCPRTERREYLALRADRRQLHNEECHKLTPSPANINRTIKSRRVRRMGNVARVGKMRNAYIFSGDLEVKRQLRDLGIDGGVVLKQTLKKQVVSMWK
jgi:hypothetical protein